LSEEPYNSSRFQVQSHSSGAVVAALGEALGEFSREIADASAPSKGQNNQW
jgi:hypothetical protein